MWHDIEAKVDLLNFNLVAEAAAQLIRDSDGQPLTIGISGGWGVGKSSLVKMVGATLQADKGADKQYVFLEFNAWLYQGFDDARQALLQAVSDKLIAIATERQTFLEKALAFRKRIRWLKIGRVAAPAIAGMAFGTPFGPVGNLLGAVAGLLKGATDVASEDKLKGVKEAYAELQPELVGLLGDKPDESLPKEIEGLRAAFEELLSDLKVTLVVLVDDLDRCLPHTAISTLEAMRLLLHVPRTAFIIAADEQMIRGAVRAHFGEVDINDDLVTSYFDKLIQVPLRVPRLGVNEVKAYVMLLLADLAARRGTLPTQALADAQSTILNALTKSWSGGVTREVLTAAFGADAPKVASEIDVAEQLAPILVTAEQISGNPRLIKRFLNNLMIRQSIAKSQGMAVGFEELVKLQLFERCASPAAFDFLAQAIASNDEGSPQFLDELESGAAKGEAYVPPHPSWGGAFYEQWVKLSPQLVGVSLKPFLYLSRDRALALASYDELSPEARKVFEASLKVTQVLGGLVAQIKAIGEAEAERVLVRLVRKARTDQWSAGAVTRCFNVTDAFANLGTQLATALAEIPAEQRPPAIGPLLATPVWAEAIVADWVGDKHTPQQLKNLLNKKKGTH
ncbi:MAG: KAP family P-loop NTPase fold protein [Acidithiobacillus sp.]